MDTPESLNPEEDRYEGIELILKSRADGISWFDVISDYITQDCDSVQLEDDEEGFEQWSPCSCGMEYMGGSGGTLDQCYKWSTNLGQGLQPIDVARVVVFLANAARAPYADAALRAKVISWAHYEIEFEEHFENREWENDVEED